MAGFLRDFKRFTSKRLKENLEATESTVPRLFVDAEGSYELWMDTNAPKKIVDPAFYVQKLNYVHENPVRKNYVAWPEHWVWSSANPNSALRFRILS
jgi:putative transposase